MLLGIDTTIASKDGSTAIVWGIEKGSVENVKLLLMKDPKLLGFSSNGNTLLHIAVCSKRLVIIKMLLEDFRHINFNMVNYNGINPIDMAAQIGGDIQKYMINELDESKQIKRANRSKYTKRVLLNHIGKNKDIARELIPSREELNLTSDDKIVSFATTEYQIKIVVL